MYYDAQLNERISKLVYVSDEICKISSFNEMPNFDRVFKHNAINTSISLYSLETLW